MSDNKLTEEEKEAKEALVCPISTALIVSPCAIKSCMWNVNGKCKFNPEISELELGEKKGLSTVEILSETRKAKASIIKIIILDKYAHWVVENFDSKPGRSQILSKDTYIVSAFTQAKLNSELFKKVSFYHFCVMCKVKNFNKFIENNPELKKNRLPSVLGIREKTIEKVRKQYKLARKGKTTPKTNEV